MRAGACRLRAAWTAVLMVAVGCGSLAVDSTADTLPPPTAAPPTAPPTVTSTTTTVPVSPTEAALAAVAAEGFVGGLQVGAVGDWYEDDPADDGFVVDAEGTRDAMMAGGVELVLGLGDFSYGTNRPQDFFEFAEPLEAQAPILPTFGNHDGFSNGVVDRARFYDQMVRHFGFDEFFVADVGPVRFVSIHSEIREGSERYEEQLFAIGQALAQAFADDEIAMIIPFFHNAMVNPLSERGPDKMLQEDFYPLLEPYASKIPLALQADHHVYTRTHPVRRVGPRDFSNCREGTPELDGICEAIYEVVDGGQGVDPVGYTNPEGIVFATVGTGGAHSTSLTPDAPYIAIQHRPESATVDPTGGTFGYLHLTIDESASSVEGQFRANNGEVLDWFRIDQG